MIGGTKSKTILTVVRFLLYTKHDIIVSQDSVALNYLGSFFGAHILVLLSMVFGIFLTRYPTKSRIVVRVICNWTLIGCWRIFFLEFIDVTIVLGLNNVSWLKPLFKYWGAVICLILFILSWIKGCRISFMAFWVVYSLKIISLKKKQASYNYSPLLLGSYS